METSFAPQRFYAETPRGKGDRSHQGFEMARRQIDDQSSDLALAHRGQLGGNDLEMPVHRQVGLRVESVKAAHREGREIVPQQDLVLSPGEVREHYISRLANRALSCSITFSSASLNSGVSQDTGSA